MQRPDTECGVVSSAPGATEFKAALPGFPQWPEGGADLAQDGKEGQLWARSASGPWSSTREGENLLPSTCSDFC
jgi:hypothetical protein